MVQPLKRYSHQQCSGKTNGCRRAGGIGYQASPSSALLTTGVYPPPGISKVPVESRTLLEALLGVESFQTFLRGLFAPGFDVIGTLVIARLFAIRTFVTRLSDMYPNQSTSDISTILSQSCAPGSASGDVRKPQSPLTMSYLWPLKRTLTISMPWQTRKQRGSDTRRNLGHWPLLVELGLSTFSSTEG